MIKKYKAITGVRTINLRKLYEQSERATEKKSCMTMNEAKGITLIALVITIIILLILAGVNI